MIMHEQIKDLFENPQQVMQIGLWFSGYKGEGEYKQWYSNGQLCRHGFYKNNRKNGEYKEWYSDGKLWTHYFYDE